MPEPIATPSVRFTAGPYSPAVRAGDWIVCSGQIGVNPTTGELANGLDEQVRQALANVTALLGDTSCTWNDVAKVTCFLATDPDSDPNSWSRVNEIYTEVIGTARPARSTVGVAWLPLGALFEIEVWAQAHNPQAHNPQTHNL